MTCVRFLQNKKEPVSLKGLFCYALTSALPRSFPSLKLRAFSIVVTAIACMASLVKNA